MAATEPTNPSTTTPAASPHARGDGLDALASELRDLGAESLAERRVRRTAPWVASVMVHTGIFVLAVLIAGTVRLITERERPLIVADFDALSYDPVTRMDLEKSTADEPVTQDQVEVDSLEQIIDQELVDMTVDPLSVISNAASESPLARFAPEPVEGSATFVGLRTSNARSIVYVIDASGSLIATLPVVIRELSRSLQSLTSDQAFGIVFFQRDAALSVPSPKGLIPATSSEKHRALEWIDENIIPGGNSNPLPALEAALRLEPDVIFLLSDNITGAGQYEVDQSDLLGMLDRLNPRASRNGRRRTRINCVQFLDPDPLDTLARIAREHGGPDGYKFLDREELGLVER
ncbi:MAG: vWA domain-containing protein [Planctomycetota bacterium]